MEANELLTLAEKREAARLQTIHEIKELWRSTDLHMNQLHRRTGIQYGRLRGFLTLNNQGVTLTDEELVNIHNALSR